MRWSWEVKYANQNVPLLIIYPAIHQTYIFPFSIVHLGQVFHSFASEANILLLNMELELSFTVGKF